jgi:hypothetical protein
VLNLERGQLNAASSLGLYVNAVSIVTTLTPAALTPASYEGYSPVDLAGLWGEPFKHQNGRWICQTNFFEFLPAAGPGLQVQVIRGAYVIRDTQLCFAGALPAAVPIAAGGVPLTFRLRIELADSVIYGRLLLP